MLKKKGAFMSIVLISMLFAGCGDKTTSAENKFIHDGLGNTRGEGYYCYTAKNTATVQLVGAGNENEKPFKCKRIEANSSGITVFTLEDDTIKIVHCDYKVNK